MDFVEKLEKCSDFEEIFKLVKDAVKSITNKRRAGIILGLSHLPDQIGAYYQVGSNFIVMNKSLLQKVLDSGNKDLINSYVFHVLLHEYIHSLGHLNEHETKMLTHSISEKAFGTEHTATKIAKYGISAVFSDISKINYGKPETYGQIEMVGDIETENLNYFG